MNRIYYSGKWYNEQTNMDRRFGSGGTKAKGLTSESPEFQKEQTVEAMYIQFRYDTAAGVIRQGR